MKSTLSLTYRGRVLILLGFLALLADLVSEKRDVNNTLQLAAAMLLAPFLVDLMWAGMSLPDMLLRIRRRRTETGSPFEETMLLQSNARGRSVTDLHLSEPRTETFAGGVFVPRLSAGQTVEVPFPARTRLRGRFQQRVVVATSSYPLGLFRRSTVLLGDNEMVSEPTRMRLPPHVLEALERPEVETVSHELVGDDEFHHLREYNPEEDARYVHALRSAATGTLVRRVLRNQQHPEACIVLDLRRPPGRSARLGSRRLEWSLGATANLIDRMRDHGTVATILVIGPEVKLFTVADNDEAADFLAFLAEARSTLHWQPDEAAFSQARDIERCLWVPAGGFKATQDRAVMGEPVLVTDWEVL